MKLFSLLEEYGWHSNFVRKPRTSGQYLVVDIFGERKYLRWSKHWRAWNVSDTDKNDDTKIPNFMIRYWKER